MRSSGGEHYLGLDHVRALAAFLVFSWHFNHGADGAPVAFAAAPAVFPLALFDEGHTGVALFMTLSGYLFAKLLDGKTVHFEKFLWNRLVRLAPLMILVLLVNSIHELRLGAPLGLVARELARGWVFPEWPNGLWSVTVELHFYLLLPLLLAAFRRFRLAALALLAAAILLRAGLYAHWGEVQSASYWTLVGRFDQFVLGIAAFRYSALVSGRHLVAAATALGFTAIYWAFDRAGGFYGLPLSPSPNPGWTAPSTSPSTNPVWIVLPTLEGFAYALLIAYYDRTFRPSNTGLSWLIGLAGSYSYSIYLLHYFYVFSLAPFINAHIMSLANFYVAQAWALACFLLAIPLGWLSFRYIEGPFLIYRTRYVRAPEEAVAPDTAGAIASAAP